MSFSLNIPVGARSSPLSRAQVKEVLQELRQFHPQVTFQPIWVETSGDKDLKTSLRTLDKTDFFTKEIDALQLSGTCRITIHSAKDLPEPLPPGLALAALTRGVDPSDVIVLRDCETLDSLPKGAQIGTSSIRREQNIKALRSDLVCVDIRGTIQARLKLLEQGVVDGVVIAEAALLRLKYTDLNRIPLSGERAPYQGQLAILAREEDEEMRELFRCIDARKTALYLGTDPTHFARRSFCRVIHYPVIKILPRSIEDPSLRQAYEALPHYTHFIFTSKNAVEVFCQHREQLHYSLTDLRAKAIFAIGEVTAKHLSRHGLSPSRTAVEETLEGMVEMLREIDLSEAYVFMPRSVLSRPILENFFKEQGIRYCACDLYDTVTQPLEPKPDLSQVDEIIFTSPSTVKAFGEIFGSFPLGKKITAIGPITEKALKNL